MRTGWPTDLTSDPSKIVMSSQSPALSSSIRPCGVEHLDLEGILRVAHVALHPPEQRVDLAEVILGRNTAREQDVDRLLAHVEVAGTVADETSDVCGGPSGAGQTGRDAAAIDARVFRRRRKVTHHAHLTSESCRDRAPALEHTRR